MTLSRLWSQRAISRAQSEQSKPEPKSSSLRLQLSRLVRITYASHITDIDDDDLVLSAYNHVSVGTGRHESSSQAAHTLVTLGFGFAIRWKLVHKEHIEKSQPLKPGWWLVVQLANVSALHALVQAHNQGLQVES